MQIVTPTYLVDGTFAEFLEAAIAPVDVAPF